MPFPKNPITNEEILAAVRDCAEKLGRAPLTAELRQMTANAVHRELINRRFGSYTRALQLCGLVRHDPGRRYSKMELFLAWATTARRLNKLPTKCEVGAETQVSGSAYRRKFGKWSLVGNGMANFMQEQKLEEEWPDVAEMIRKAAAASRLQAVQVIPAKIEPPEMQTVDQQCGQTAADATGRGAELPAEPVKGLIVSPAQGLVGLQSTAAPRERPVYGEPINHPCMANAPTNEDGVLGLFVAMARDLGFIVKRIQRPFPDIEALRKMKDGRWKLTLAELEYESLSFVTHGHDPNGCDLIICWIHNWKECPLEVIELRRLFGIG